MDIMDKRINLTEKELQLIHVACMMYGNELSDISKRSSPTENMSKSLKARAEEFWNLGKRLKVIWRAHVEQTIKRNGELIKVKLVYKLMEAL